MTTRIWILGGFLALSLSACRQDTQSMGEDVGASAQRQVVSDHSAFPENDLDLEDDILAATGITEDQFNTTLDHIRFLYTPLFLFHGGELVLSKDWASSTVNAYASRSGNKWNVAMYGGLARRKEITVDGFALVACHEIGHHLAGYPFYSGNLNWAAVEGQSDWYSTQACGRWLWVSDAQRNAEFRTTADPVLRARCDDAWSETLDRDLCYRVGTAGKSLADLMGALEGTTVDFSKRDSSEVTQTLTAHPRAQCRLDTVVAGALCGVTPNFDVIPGLNAVTGRNSVLAEVEAAAWECHPASAWIGTEGYNHQDHPRCWFKNQLDGAGTLVP